jgi:hypothetical protein
VSSCLAVIRCCVPQKRGRRARRVRYTLRRTTHDTTLCPVRCVAPPKITVPQQPHQTRRHTLPLLSRRYERRVHFSRPLSERNLITGPLQKKSYKSTNYAERALPGARSLLTSLCTRPPLPARAPHPSPIPYRWGEPSLPTTGTGLPVSIPRGRRGREGPTFFGRFFALHIHYSRVRSLLLLLLVTTEPGPRPAGPLRFSAPSRLGPLARPDSLQGTELSHLSGSQGRAGPRSCAPLSSSASFSSAASCDASSARRSRRVKNATARAETRSVSAKYTDVASPGSSAG